MGWSAGTFTLTDGTYNGPGVCAQQAGDGDATIYATEVDALFDDLATGVNSCLLKDGTNAASANLNLGSNKITALANGSVTTDAAAYGQTITALSFDGGTNILTATRSAGNLTADFSTLAAGTGGVDLTTDQTVAGIKTFSAITSLAHAKFNGPRTSKVESVASSSTPTFDSTAEAYHFITVAQNQTWTITWPTAASDTQLGANWVKTGAILARWSGASYTVSLDSTMLSALTDYEIEGTHTTGSGEMSALTYTYWYINGSKYAQFAWVATP